MPYCLALELMTFLPMRFLLGLGCERYGVDGWFHGIRGNLNASEETAANQYKPCAAAHFVEGAQAEKGKMSNPFLGNLSGLGTLAGYAEQQATNAMLNELRAIRTLLEQLVKEKGEKIDPATP